MNQAKAGIELRLRRLATLNGMKISDFSPPSDHEIILNHMRFHYLDWGGTDPLVLFLHGGSLTAHTWDLVCAALRDSWHCIALDLRGHGDSEWSPSADYEYDTQASDVAALLDALAVNTAALVGMSMGGLVATALAGRGDPRIAALALVDVGPHVQEVGTSRIGDFLSQTSKRATLDEFVHHALSFYPRRDPELLKSSLRHNLRSTPDGLFTWKWDYRRREQSREERNQQRLDLWKSVAQITCETLVLRGEQSDVFSEDDRGQLVARLQHARSVSVPNAGHNVQGDNAPALVAELREFFRDTRYGVKSDHGSSSG